MAKTGYGGYFLKGLGKGIGQGMQWGTQLLNIRAQKKAREDAEKLKEKITLQSQELMTMINEYGPQYTDEEASAIRTFAYASVVEVQDRFKPMLDNIAAGRIKEAEIQMGQIKDYCDYIAELDLTPGQVTQAMDNFRKGGYFTSKGAQDYFDAEERKLKAKVEAREMQPKPEEPEGYTKLADLFAVYGENAPYKFDTTTKKYIPTYKAPSTLSAADKKFNWAWEAYQKEEGEPGKIGFGEFKKYAGITPEKETGLEKQISDIKVVGEREGISTEEISKRVKNVILGMTPEEPVKRVDIEYWRKREDTVKSEEDWDRYKFDLEQSESTYETEDATWKDRLLRDIKDLEAGIKEQLLDEGGKIRLLDKDGTPKEIYIGGEKMTIEEAYTRLQKLYEEKVRELMEKYPDVTDISKLIKFLSLEEIGTVKAWDVASRMKGYLSGEARDISLISKY